MDGNPKVWRTHSPRKIKSLYWNACASPGSQIKLMAKPKSIYFQIPCDQQHTRDDLHGCGSFWQFRSSEGEKSNQTNEFPRRDLEVKKLLFYGWFLAIFFGEYVF